MSDAKTSTSKTEPLDLSCNPKPDGPDTNNFIRVIA
jgi:hypothetical protein